MTLAVVAGRGATQSSCAKPSKAKPRLKVTLSPRKVRSGHRVRVVVRVRARGKAVRGAVVKVSGRRAHTGKRGKAKLRVRFAKAGRKRVTASARGYRTGRARIQVVR